MGGMSGRLQCHILAQKRCTPSGVQGDALPFLPNSAWRSGRFPHLGRHSKFWGRLPACDRGGNVSGQVRRELKTSGSTDSIPGEPPLANLTSDQFGNLYRSYVSRVAVKLGMLPLQNNQKYEFPSSWQPRISSE